MLPRDSMSSSSSSTTPCFPLKRPPAASRLLDSPRGRPICHQDAPREPPDGETKRKNGQASDASRSE
eukprot:3552091-Pyramimonas_sp.AAC.1